MQRLCALLEPCSLLFTHIIAPENQVFSSLVLRMQAAAEQCNYLWDTSLE